jgi:hypothetical protein
MFLLPFKNNIKVMKHPNKLIHYLVKVGKLTPVGTPHYGGQQIIYLTEDKKWGGNLNLTNIGEIIYYMTDDEIMDFVKAMRKKKVVTEE